MLFQCSAISIYLESYDFEENMKNIPRCLHNSLNLKSNASPLAIVVKSNLRRSRNASRCSLLPSNPKSDASSRNR